MQFPKIYYQEKNNRYCTMGTYHILFSTLNNKKTHYASKNFVIDVTLFLVISFSFNFRIYGFQSS